LPFRFLPVLLLAGCVSAAVPSAPPPAATGLDTAEAACVSPGNWYDAHGRQVAANSVLRRAAAAPAVLLGERHDRADHHRWQLQTLAAVHALNPNVAIGLEMLPRSKQGVLDRWVAGDLSEAQLLEQSDWSGIWAVDLQLYLPILHFARMNRLPLVAVNIERALVTRTRREGWAAVPVAERGGVGDPAPAPEGYIDYLAAALGAHGEGEKKAFDRDAPEFRRFVEAQSVWDRAMAERIAETHRDTGRTVVVMVGYGHIEQRYGIPHQLDALGVRGAAVLLPWDGARQCSMFDGTLADAVFAMAAAEETEEAPRPRLGVTLEPTKDGLRIGRITEGSVAAKSGLAVGDILESAAGTPVKRMADVTAVVQRQAPGTWLPLTVRRGGKPLSLVAKFPPP